MDFPLLFTEQLAALAPARQKAQVLATNRAAMGSYGIQLTPDEAAMIVAAGREAVRAEGLVLFGGGITPRLIRWFLPSGYLAGNRYAQNIAALTEAFYRLRGALQELYDKSDDPDCVLSDNALLDYMYRFYTSPQCAGDVDEMVSLAERILIPAMRRLLAKRAEERSAGGSHYGTDSELLYADSFAEMREPTDLEREAWAEDFDQRYRAAMRRDVFGQYEADYVEDPADRFRGSDAEELERMLLRNPELLLPSESQEAEWADMVEKWEEEDAQDE